MAKEIICGIYKITSPSGKIYIGQAVDIYWRWKGHRNSGKYDFVKGKLVNSIKKYGHEAHKFEIIEICNEKLLNEREIYWIAFYDSRNIETGLNLREGGSTGRHSEESKKLMSINSAQLGKIPWNKGIPCTLEQKQKLREANLGKTYSEESKAKRAESRKGYRHSQETIEKIKESKKNRRLEQGITEKVIKPKKNKIEKKKKEYVRKGRPSGENHPMYGRKRPDLVERNKASSEKFTGEGNPFYGKKHTEETKRKIRESKKKK